MTDKPQPTPQRRVVGEGHVGHRADQDEHERQRDDPDRLTEGRMRDRPAIAGDLGLFLHGFWHAEVDAVADVAAEDDAAHRDGGHACDEAEDDHPAEVGVEQTGDGHRTRRGRDEAVCHGHAG